MSGARICLLCGLDVCFEKIPREMSKLIFKKGYEVALYALSISAVFAFLSLVVVKQCRALESEATARRGGLDSFSGGY